MDDRTRASTLALTLALTVLAPAGAASARPTEGADALREERRLPFIADDYPRALAEARRRELPLFVESWAPW